MDLTYIVSFVATKLSFVALYLRVFPEKSYRRVNSVLGAILVCQLIEEIIVVLLECTPLKKTWDPTVQGSCLNILLFLYISFAVKLVTDIVLFVLPVLVLRKLQISFGKKVGLILMFSLGLL